MTNEALKLVGEVNMRYFETTGDEDRDRRSAEWMTHTCRLHWTSELCRRDSKQDDIDNALSRRTSLYGWDNGYASLRT